MAHDRKKTPKTTLRKRVTASARAHVSTTRRKQTRSTPQEGSFLQQFDKDIVSNALASSNDASGPSIQPMQFLRPTKKC